MIEKSIRRKLESSVRPLARGTESQKKMLYTTTTHTYILLLSNCTKRSRKKISNIVCPPMFSRKKNNTTWRKRKKGGTLPQKRYNIIPPQKNTILRAVFPGPNHSPVQHFPVPWVNWELFLEEWCICMRQNRYISVPLWYENNNNIKTKNSSDFFWCICIIIKTKSFRTQIYRRLLNTNLKKSNDS